MLMFDRLRVATETQRITEESSVQFRVSVEIRLLKKFKIF